MGQLRFLLTTIFRATLARLGLPLLVLSAPASLVHCQQRPSVSELLQQFETTRVFWQQFEVAKAIVATKDTGVLPKLQSWLTHDDRHLRGNAAFIYARLGDTRGFDVITAILRDYAERPEGQGIPASRWALRDQILAARYYAVHLLVDLTYHGAVPILV